MARAALLLLLLAASGSARLPGLTVSDVWRQHAALDGQRIRVSGVVVECRRLSCALRENRSPDARALGLGSSDRFDAAIQSRLGLPIVIEGRLDATCLHGRADRLTGPHGAKEFICLDRSAELADPRIVSFR
jgi:hypothetical protein